MRTVNVDGNTCMLTDWCFWCPKWKNKEDIEAVKQLRLMIRVFVQDESQVEMDTDFPLGVVIVGFARGTRFSREEEKWRKRQTKDIRHLEKVLVQTRDRCSLGLLCRTKTGFEWLARLNSQELYRGELGIPMKTAFVVGRKTLEPR